MRFYRRRRGARFAEDYKLTTRAVHLKPELFGVQNQDVIRRLTNRYRLFAESDSLTVEIPAFKEDGIPDPQKPKEKFGPLTVDRERNRIKQKYVSQAGKFGSLILRRNMHDFEQEIGVLKAKLEAYKQAVQAELKKRTDQIVTELLDALMERLQREPPRHWRSRYLDSTPTAEDVKRLFEEDVRDAVERVKTDFNPQILITYKGITYETFNDPEFITVIEGQFGRGAVAQILSERDVAPEVNRDQDGRY